MGEQYRISGTVTNTISNDMIGISDARSIRFSNVLGQGKTFSGAALTITEEQNKTLTATVTGYCDSRNYNADTKECSEVIAVGTEVEVVEDVRPEIVEEIKVEENAVEENIENNSGSENKENVVEESSNDETIIEDNKEEL